MDKKKILITGCGGMVGSSMYPVMVEEGYEVLATDKDVNEDWLEYLDVRDLDSVKNKVLEFKPDIIIHLAALTSLEYCEDNLEDSYKTNYLATRNLAELANKLDISLVYTSTAGTFDGKGDKYLEESYQNPINVYGKTKLYGELAVLHITKKHFVLRPGWMFGGGKKDKKFISYILKQVSEGATELNVVNDKFGTPTYTYDLSKTVAKLLSTEKYGVYNAACKGETNRVEMTKEILKIINREDIKINEVDSDFFKSDFSVPRAQSEILVDKNLDKENLNEMRNWRGALEHYLKKEWSHLINNQ